PEKRGQGFALFGVAVVVAPVVGPTLGGYLADNYSWHWCFLINGPIGVVAIALIALLLREAAAAVEEQRRRLLEAGGFDLVGFVLVATFLGALEIVLDRGLVDDWFSSTFIVTFALISAAAFALMIPWEASRRNPMIDIRMVGTRQFGACFVVMLAIGAILYATTQFLPQLVQQNFGYTATWAGLPVAGRCRRDGVDVRRRPPLRQGAAQIHDHGGRYRRSPFHVRHDPCVRRSRFLVFRALAHAARHRAAADLPLHHHRLLRRHSARE